MTLTIELTIKWNIFQAESMKHILMFTLWLKSLVNVWPGPLKGCMLYNPHGLGSLLMMASSYGVIPFIRSMYWGYRRREYRIYSHVCGLFCCTSHVAKHRWQYQIGNLSFLGMNWFPPMFFTSPLMQISIRCEQLYPSNSSSDQDTATHWSGYYIRNRIYKLDKIFSLSLYLWFLIVIFNVLLHPENETFFWE